MIPVYTIKFTTIDQVQQFIDRVRKLPCDIDACHGHYIVDAKSVLGILSLSLGREIELNIHSNDLDDYKMLEEICSDFN